MEGSQDSLESGIQIKEPGFPLTIAIRNPSSTCPVHRIRNPQREIQHSRLPSITLHGAICIGNGTEWSTIQGVIGRVTSNWADLKLRARLPLNCTTRSLITN